MNRRSVVQIVNTRVIMVVFVIMFSATDMKCLLKVSAVPLWSFVNLPSNFNLPILSFFFFGVYFARFHFYYIPYSFILIVGFLKFTIIFKPFVQFPIVSLEFFKWHNPVGCTMALGLTQPLTKMSSRCISWG